MRRTLFAFAVGLPLTAAGILAAKAAGASDAVLTLIGIAGGLLVTLLDREGFYGANGT